MTNVLHHVKAMKSCIRFVHMYLYFCGLKSFVIYMSLNAELLTSNCSKLILCNGWQVFRQWFFPHFVGYSSSATRNALIHDPVFFVCCLLNILTMWTVHSNFVQNHFRHWYCHDRVQIWYLLLMFHIAQLFVCYESYRFQIGELLFHFDIILCIFWCINFCVLCITGYM